MRPCGSASGRRPARRRISSPRSPRTRARRSPVRACARDWATSATIRWTCPPRSSPVSCAAKSTSTRASSRRPASSRSDASADCGSPVSAAAQWIPSTLQPRVRRGRLRTTEPERSAECGRRGHAMAKQRISYVPLEKMDAEMRKEMERCQREGTPRPESSAVRAHVRECFWAFANSWRDIFKNGVCDHSIKELCRLYVSRSVQCEYCGNQRSIKAASSGAVIEDHVKDLLNFEKSGNYDERQKAALAYAEAISWHLNADDAFWERLHRHFSEPELVELGCFIALTMGQQSWLRLLNIDHHQVLAGTSASMAPGFEDAKALAEVPASAWWWSMLSKRSQLCCPMVSAMKQPSSTSSGSPKCLWSRSQNASSVFRCQVIASAYASAAFWRSS